MKKVSILALFVLISMNIAVSQNNDFKKNIFCRIDVSEIQSKEFNKIYHHFNDVGFLVLPAYFDSNFITYLKKYNLYGGHAYPYHYNNGESPFYVNANKNDKTRNDGETVMSYLYNETSGNYILGVIRANAKAFKAITWWLVTFNFSGNVIDYIPIRGFIGDVRTTDAQIDKNFTVDIQHLDFPDNDCIIKANEEPLDNLKGQRIDTKYEITTDGKFKKLNEVRYQPQIYPPATLLDRKVNIRDRGEKKM